MGDVLSRLDSTRRRGSEGVWLEYTYTVATGGGHPGDTVEADRDAFKLRVFGHKEVIA